MAGRLRSLLGLFLLLAVRPCLAWESWDGNPRGSRFSPARKITFDNVGQLVCRARDRHADDRGFALASTAPYPINVMLACVLCERSFTSCALLQEGEADAPVVSPHRAAIPHETIA